MLAEIVGILWAFILGVMFGAWMSKHDHTFGIAVGIVLAILLCAFSLGVVATGGF